VLSGTRRIGETRDPTPFLISLKYVSEELQIFQKNCKSFRRNGNVSELSEEIKMFQKKFFQRRFLLKHLNVSEEARQLILMVSVLHMFSLPLIVQRTRILYLATYICLSTNTGSCR
jgi:hypothetical protein